MTEPTDSQPDAADDAKKALRATMRASLRDLDPAARTEASHLACRRLVALESFAHASVVMLYMPLATEVDTLLAAIRAFQLNKTVCVPKVDWARRDMRPVEVTSLDDDYMGVDEHGIRTPRDGRVVVPGTIDFIVVPALAYDARGNRLGRGGGYYDRFLPRLRRSAAIVGLAFDFQVVDEVPIGRHDVTVDTVVTDRRVSHAGRARHRR